jgi:cell division protein FtsB
MRIRRSVTRLFGISVIPAISLAVVCYFGYYAIWGERGILALSGTEARLGVEHEQLVQAQDRRARLEHRIALMRSGHPDADLIEELARGQFLMAPPGTLAIRRPGNQP